MFIYSLLLSELSITLIRLHLTRVLFIMACGLVTGAVFCLTAGVRLRVRQSFVE